MAAYRIEGITGRMAIHHITGDIHYLAIALPRNRTVLTIHDCATLDRLRGWRLRIFRAFWFTWPMRRAAVVTTISESSRAELRRHVGPLADGVRVVPDCVDPNLSPAPKNFHSEKPTCLQVGTGWNKNVERVAQALDGSGCRLKIVGELTEKQRSTLANLSLDWIELGRISDEDLREAYRCCDFLIFASLYEGFGLPILEAQATGRPVITSDRGAMLEVAGEGAIFVDPESAESIRSAVLRILSSAKERERLVMGGFVNVRRYSASAIAQRYSDIYGELVCRVSQ